MVSEGSAENGWRAAVRPVGVLADSALVRAVHAGFPLRYRFTLELWRDRFVDALAGRTTWSVVLAHEPLSGRYRLHRSWEEGRAHWFAELDSARAAIEVWYLTPLPPPEPGSGAYYYDARLEIEAITVSDLEELERWLRGEIGPTASGGVPGAVARGVRSLFIRLAGLGTRRYEARTRTFRP